MRKFLLMLFIGAFFSKALFAQENIVAKFQARAHSLQNTTLPYRLFIPDNYDPARKYSLVLALHGSGERGSDNITHIRSYRLATAWADPVNQAQYPCFVAAPQCPLNQSWNVGSIVATVSDLLDSLTREFNIDPNRLYITGLSMGGYGTWDMITRFPNRFAAAIPMSAGWDPATATKITHIPIWNFHGALDEVVPVSWSRDMIAELEQTGRSVVYTHCNNRNCTGLPDSLIANQVASHANLLYTEFETGGHVIWDESYDYPLLFPWVFDKYKMTPGAIALTRLNYHQVLSGIETISWNAVNPADRVEIWFSPDAGRNWQIVSRAEPNSGTYTWNTKNAGDCSFGLLKIFLKNAEGYIYSNDQSSYFTINNGVNGTPFVKILNKEFDAGQTFDQSPFELELWVGDAETDPLNVRLYYSADGGETFSLFDSYTTLTDTVSQKRTIDLAVLPNSNIAVIKVEVSDGNTSFADQTYHFIKRTARQTGLKVSQLAGNSGARITPQVVDPSQLTGNHYRITFDDTSFGSKVYDVLDVTRAVKVAENATALDGVTEGPLFDGIRLLIKDFDPAEADFANTGWSSGASTWHFVVVLPTINLGNEILQGYPQPADYNITLFDHVVDTSNTAYGAPAVPMKFTVRNLTENRKANIIFLDTNGDQALSLFDEIFILEPDSLSNLRLTWSISFTGSPNDTPPQPGDEFVFKTLKPITKDDVFEFRATLTSVRHDDSSPLPGVLTLFPNYPNPFNPATTIRYYLPKAEHVKIAVYNLLGQEIITLVDDRQLPGLYTLQWDGRDKQQNAVGSGVYFYKIATSDQSLVRKMVLMR